MTVPPYCRPKSTVYRFIPRFLWAATVISFISETINDFHNIFIDEAKVSQPLL